MLWSMWSSRGPSRAMQGRDFFYNAPCRCRKVDPVILLMVQISANQVSRGKYPIIYKVLYIPGGCLGFLPSTVLGERLAGRQGWWMYFSILNEERLSEAFRILQKSQGGQDVSHKKPLAFLDINYRRVGKPSFTLVISGYVYSDHRSQWWENTSVFSIMKD